LCRPQKPTVCTGTDGDDEEELPLLKRAKLEMQTDIKAELRRCTTLEVKPEVDASSTDPIRHEFKKELIAGKDVKKEPVDGYKYSIPRTSVFRHSNSRKEPL
jgi:hypothetical protein